MRSSVPCSSWIDSFSLLDIQVVSLKRDYYVSLACQVDFVRNNPSRTTPQELAVRGLRNHTTIEISLSPYGLRFGPGMGGNSGCILSGAKPRGRPARRSCYGIVLVRDLCMLFGFGY